MRSVNANLLEINQAKSRINQAKKEGKTNVDLNAPTTPDNTPGGSTPSGGSSTTEVRLRQYRISKKNTKCVSFSDFICTFAMSYKKQLNKQLQ